MLVFSPFTSTLSFVLTLPHCSFIPRGGIQYKYNMLAGFQGLLSHTLNNAQVFLNLSITLDFIVERNESWQPLNTVCHRRTYLGATMKEKPKSDSVFVGFLLRATKEAAFSPTLRKLGAARDIGMFDQLANNCNFFQTSFGEKSRFNCVTSLIGQLQSLS